MDIQERQAGDVAQLQQRMRRAQDAAQRDRYRVVILAIAGEATGTIQTKLDRSRAFVQRWAYAYRDGGIEAIRARQPTGAKCKLTPMQQQAFKQRMLAGPTEADGVCTLRGRDAQRIIKQQYGKRYSLPGVYDLMHRLGLEPLRPRPRHRKNDPQAMQAWLDDAPLLSSKSATHTRTNPSKCGSRMKPASASKAP